MRILSIQPESPYAANSGGNIRNRSIVNALSEHGTVTVLAFDDPGEFDSDQNAKVLRIKNRSSGQFWTYRNAFRPLSHVFHRNERKQIADLIDSLNPDVAFVEGVNLRDCLAILRRKGVTSVLDTHNVESKLFAKLLLKNPRSYRPRLFVRNLVKVVSARFEETSTLLKADHVWACSSQDANVLGKMSRKNVNLVGNPIPDAKLLELPIVVSRYQSVNVLFAGHMAYLPNYEAIKTLTGKIAPNLPENATLTIAGRSVSDKQKKEISQVGAILEDSPLEMLPVLANASYTILPITSGGGTRIKVLEALAAGVLVIATAKAVEGLGLVDNEHFIHAERPEEMIEALSQMRNTPEEAVKIARAGRRFAVAEHGPDVISNAVARALSAIDLT